MKKINMKSLFISLGVSSILSLGHLLLAHFNLVTSASRAFPNANNTSFNSSNFISYLILIPFAMMFLYPVTNKLFKNKKEKDEFKENKNKF